MPIDIGRIVVAAIEAATQPEQPPAPQPKLKKKRRHPVRKAMLVGAGVYTAGRLIAGPKAREMVGSVQQRIADSDWLREDDKSDEGETEAEDFGEEEYEADEPTAESDEDFDEDEEATEPDEDFDEDEDEDVEAESDEDFDGDKDDPDSQPDVSSNRGTGRRRRQ